MQKATWSRTGHRMARCGASATAGKDRDTEAPFRQPARMMRFAPPKGSGRTNFGRSKRSSPRTVPDSSNPSDAPDLRTRCTNPETLDDYSAEHGTSSSSGDRRPTKQGAMRLENTFCYHGIDSMASESSTVENQISLDPSGVDRRNLFLRACRSEPLERVPVWIMRQAGRYLPEYQEVRKTHTFLEICKTADVAAEVSLQPFRIIGVDAIIVFSDILIVAEAMGMPLDVPDSGPVLSNPVRELAAVRKLRDFDPDQDTRFVGDAIRAICREAGPKIPVIGFA